MALTDKQEMFIEKYLISFNATQAALEAGYSPKTARSIGAENLTKPDIAEAISQHLRETAMSADEALMRLGQHARGDMSDYWSIPESGDPWLNLSSDKAKGKLHLIKKMKVKRTVRTIKDEEIVTTEAEIELYDAQVANKLIGQHHGSFVERQELTGKDGGPIQTNSTVQIYLPDNGRDQAAT